jgi:hypothetical protein
MREAAPKNNSMSSLKHKDCPSEDDEPPPHIQPQEHHSISSSILHKIQLSTWLGENQDDPILKVGMHCIDRAMSICLWILIIMTGMDVSMLM